MAQSFSDDYHLIGLHMIASILKFELRYRLKRPATYIYSGIFLALGLLITLTDAIRIGGSFGKIHANAPYTIHFFIMVLAILGLFIIQAVMSVPVQRDWEHNSDSFLFAYPITKNQYLAGRFLGSLIVVLVMYAFLPFGMAIGEAIGKMKADDPTKYGPFRFDAYVMPYLVAAVPNVLLLSALFFSLVALTRKVMISYVVAISFIVVYSISQNLLSDIDNKFIASLLDPFGITASERLTEYWTPYQKNNQLVPMAGQLLINRLAWLGVAFALLAYTFFRFKLSVGAAGKPKKVAETEKEVYNIPAVAPVATLSFSKSDQLKQFLTLVKLEVGLSLRNLYFLAIGFAIALFMVMDAWYSDYSYGTGIYPVTGTVLENVTSGNFFVLSLALLIFMAGEVVWRERQFKMEGIYDAFPIASSTSFLSKLVAMFAIPLLLLTLVPLVCIPVQLIKGYTNLELGLYFKYLYLFEFPKLCLFAAFAFVVQNVVNNKFQGHVLVLLYYLGNLGFQRIGLEHPLWRFGSGMSFTYSDMNGFGHYYKPVFSNLAHWYLVLGLLASIAFLMYHRGSELNVKARLVEAGKRWKRLPSLKAIAIVSFVGMLGTGYWIYYNTVVLDRYMSEKASEKRAVAFEKKYKKRLEKKAKPKFTDVKIVADIYPEELRMKTTGTYRFKNKTNQAIDTMWLYWSPDAVEVNINIDLKNTIAWTDEEFKLSAYVFDKPLQPGDSGTLTFTEAYQHKGFGNGTSVHENGTFFNNTAFIGNGYPDNYELSDDDKRKEYGLPEKERPAPYTDQEARQNHFISDSDDYVNFEATLSTSPDQIAIAPGYLQRKWEENGRAYFHYKMDFPILNFVSFVSARYAVHKDKWNDVAIEIYHHPTHIWNLEKMTESVKQSLDYYSRNFGPYQHKQVRILEFPRYSSFAQSFDNTIPYSEGIGFVAKLTDPEDVDYVYFVTAHEMGHQWWAHQVVPAATRGAQFLSESMSEYSAVKIMQEKYGPALSGKFLRYEMNQYLRGRSSEKKYESTLMDVEMQSYVYYPKGSISVFAMQDYIGEKAFNGFLKRYVDSVRFAGPPYTVMPEFYNQLLRITPDSLREFVDDNLKRITIYRNKITEAKGKKVGDKFEVTLKVELEKVYADSLGKETQAKINIPIEVGLLAEKKPKKADDLMFIEKRRLKNKDTVVLTFNKKPTYAGVDPMHKLIDENLDDNVVKVEWD